MRTERERARTNLGDAFDKAARAMRGLPDVTETRETTVTVQSKMFELSQTYILRTVRQRDEGDTIFLQYIDKDGSFRIALPPLVAKMIAAQRRILKKKVRQKIGWARAEQIKAEIKFPANAK